MTDLELMQLLDEQGYEATLENLEILKEGLETGAYEIKNVATIEKKPSELTSDIDSKDVYDDEEHEQEEDVGEVVVESNTSKIDLKRRDEKAMNIYKNLGSEFSLDDPKYKKIKDTGNHGKEERFTARKKAEMQRDLENQAYLFEEFSDYELYQLLEMEGYETTNENLEILKEGLYSGEIEILNEKLTPEKIEKKVDKRISFNNGLRAGNGASEDWGGHKKDKFSYNFGRSLSPLTKFGAFHKRVVAPVEDGANHRDKLTKKIEKENN